MQQNNLFPNKIYWLFLIGLTLIISCSSDSNSGDWDNLRTVEDSWNHRPDRIRSLIKALKLEGPELKAIHNELIKGDTIKALENLLDYYKNIDRNWVVSTLDELPYEEAVRQANLLLEDSYIRQGQEYLIPTDEKGGWQWNYTGPDKDDEFGYGLNGHKYLSALLKVWEKTGDKKYIQKLDAMLRDWIIHHPLPKEGAKIYEVWDRNATLDYRDIGEVEWRTLETGHRLGASWPQLFFALQQESSFSDATRLLLLSSLAEQSQFLSRYHKFGHNWTTMEMNGLALAGLSFPEFKGAAHWEKYALDVMQKEINRQVYPDGTQTEISSKTQWVALNRFETLAANFKRAGRKISEEYLNRVIQMYDYLAYCMRPDGHQPLNNDSDRDDLKPRVLKAAKKFNRPDWEAIATNGKSGILPTGNPSLTFPWAGIHVMRNSWQQDADWSFFETGPYGTGHQHRDKLHLSIAAFGKDILVDGGRYTHKDYFNFDPAFWRGYFRSSYSHNVLLVDENGQKAGPKTTDQAQVEGVDYIHKSDYDYAYGSFNDGYEKVEGEAVHSRSVLYIKNKYWVVLDHFKTDRPRKIQALWHYAPNYDIKIEGKETVSISENEPNLRIVPLGTMSWDVEMVKGQEKPVIQGWYSSVFGEKVTSPAMVYSTNIQKTSTFAWVMIPGKGEVPKVKAQLKEKNGVVSINLKEPNSMPVTIVLPIEKNISKVKVIQN